jgi:hypothetical protein
MVISKELLQSWNFSVFPLTHQVINVYSGVGIMRHHINLWGFEHWLLGCEVVTKDEWKMLEEIVMAYFRLLCSA